MLLGCKFMGPSTGKGYEQLLLIQFVFLAMARVWQTICREHVLAVDTTTSPRLFFSFAPTGQDHQHQVPCPTEIVT